ncbi:TPA: UDP-N-acetylmuramoyl-L-alanyl-D-glutamate--2,6-diaminopimelate ligase [Candidatus Poribacteria bacterium]|nr:UDP-N-acetylmuramoyl-L-alanyl-D-glutamate--2,6-diaminopimelate ligase [Candidatus Poribacteria bacterium]
MRLKELFRGLEVLYCDADPDMEISGVEHDSRRVAQGYAFVCLTGFKQDGHRFICDAIKRGAVLLVSERDLHTVDGVGRVKVKDAREALALMAANFYGNPSSELKVIGVTGTNGKTTTAHLTWSILGSAGVRSAIFGTIAHRIGSHLMPALNTTPDGLEIQRMLRKSLDEELDGVVMEVSSHALELKRVDGVRFDVGVFTNLTWDHLDFHGTFERYREAKLKLMDLLKTGGYAVINLDDPSAGFFLKRAKSAGAGIIGYGLNSRDGEISADPIDSTINGLRFRLKTPIGEGMIELKLPGGHNIYNAMAASGVGVAMGLSFDVIKAGLESLERVAGRFEPVDLGQDFAVIVDYAHTPDALKGALKTARRLTKGRLISIFGCGGDRDKAKRPRMGEISTRLADHTIITSDNPRTEEPMEIIRQILKGVRPDSSYEVEPDRERAIAKAIRSAQKDDLILIAGKGHEDYQIIGDQKIHFDDREVAAKYIKEVLGEP